MAEAPEGVAEDAYRVLVLPGDGIGPEVVRSTCAVLDAATAGCGVRLVYEEHEAGAGLYRRTGQGITETTMQRVDEVDAVLLGAMGLPDVRKPDGTEITPQLDLRERFHLFASLRPVRLLPGVEGALRSGHVDMLVIREITEGLFAGRHDPPAPTDGPDSSSTRLTITRVTSTQLFDVAFQQARQRRLRGSPGRVTLFDKANVLRPYTFMREIFVEVAERHPDVESECLYVDAGSMLMVLDPDRFDVIVTENQFGDIVSELGAGIAGGLGLAPSADVGVRHGVFQPSHGTAPDLAGRGVANPLATVLSGAMMLDWLALQHDDAATAQAARAVRAAVEAVTLAGIRTPDLGGSHSTDEVTAALTSALA